MKYKIMLIGTNKVYYLLEFDLMFCFDINIYSFKKIKNNFKQINSKYNKLINKYFEYLYNLPIKKVRKIIYQMFDKDYITPLAIKNLGQIFCKHFLKDLYKKFIYKDIYAKHLILDINLLEKNQFILKIPKLPFYISEIDVKITKDYKLIYNINFYYRYQIQY